MKRVIAIIATRDRPKLLENAVLSALSQTLKACEIIVSSDSIEENFESEKAFLKGKATLIRNKYAHNYGGNLNTAIDYLLEEHLGDKTFSYEETYLAFLDDDDVWHVDYLERCVAELKPDVDMVVGLIHYLADGKDFILDLPEELNQKSFLAVNPHVQGSNTFIRLKTLLMAGAFDEGISSTTDRDFFTRVMMLNPKVAYIPHPLLDVDAHDDRPRLTNSSSGKKKSLAYFYSKYAGIMDENIEEVFFKRALRYTDLSKDEVANRIPQYQGEPYKPYSDSPFGGRLVIGFITSDEALSSRLLDDIDSQNIEDLKVVVFFNGENPSAEYRKRVERLGLLFSLNEAKSDLGKMPYADYIRPSLIRGSHIEDIACSRMVLHYYLKENSKDGDAIWVFDEDMRLMSVVRENGAFKTIPLDIKVVTSHFFGKADVVVGSYSGDAPLPTLSVLRTSLVDYVYAEKLNKSGLYQTSCYGKRDYYYDLSEDHTALECPLPIGKGETLEEILSGKGVSRKLFVGEESVFEPYSRGGNTLIFNRDALDVPNLSAVFDNTIARRSDYFWVQMLKNLGYTVLGSSFATLHNRPIQEFDMRRETEKSLKDLLGSSFTKAMENPTTKSREGYLKNFTAEFKKRLVRLIDSLYRDLGLFQVLGRAQPFGESDIKNLVRKALAFLDESTVIASYEFVRSMEIKYLASRKFLKLAKDNGLSLPALLGMGNEGAVFRKGKEVIKVFYDDFDTSILEKYGQEFGKSDQLFPIKVIKEYGHTTITYECPEAAEAYESGHAIEIARLIRFLRKRGLVLKNIKRDNFLIVNGALRFVDYGKDIVPLTDANYEAEVKRAYEMIRYPNLTVPEYKKVVAMSHVGEDGPLCFGIENFKKLIEVRSKESIHDGYVLKRIAEYHPDSILDYGAGKCKIINAAHAKTKAAFDIDSSIVRSRANHDVRIIENIDEEHAIYDLITCNLVLCATDSAWDEKIVRNIHRLLCEDGHAIISVCDMFFDDVQRTETRQSGYSGKYESEALYGKATPLGIHKDYHKSFGFYENLFRRNGFEIVSVQEDDGVDVDSLNSIGEHLIFDLKKKEAHVLSDCSLLIKCCAMDHGVVDPFIRSMIRKLENGVCFAERIVVVDGKRTNRNRAYQEDDEAALKSRLESLGKEGLIDRIVYCDNAKGFEAYRKYFGKSCTEAYAENGQQLLTTLKGFDAIKTRYVFQTDVDIAYFGNDHDEFYEEFARFRKSQAIVGTPSVLHLDEGKTEFGKRVEVRSCFIDIETLKNRLPIENPINDGKFALPWHRTLDATIDANESIRFHHKGFGFIHFPNGTKKNPNFISAVLNAKKIPAAQYGSVDVVGEEKDWLPQIKDGLIVFSRGRNVELERSKRLLDSISAQNEGFHFIYFDDFSVSKNAEYLRMKLTYDPVLKGKSTLVSNARRVSSLANFERMLSMVINPNAIIVNVDGDDALIGENALSTIRDSFDEGADLTIGNCLRFDKPLRRYALESFRSAWDRGGDNIWCHPKCFMRYLAGYIGNNLKDPQGDYIEVATDYAMMLPMVEAARHPEFIDEVIYFFDPSEENKTRTKQYEINKKGKVKAMFLEKAKAMSKKPIVAIIGDAGIKEDDPRYKIAREMGKALIENGYRLQNGGMDGVMEASSKGAHDAKEYEFGDTISILPGSDESEGNIYGDLKVATGMDHKRAELVVDASAVIAIGGGSGTLEEIAVAWETYKLIIAFEGVSGWSGKVANTRIDDRKRYKDIPEDKVFGARTVDEALAVIKAYRERYTKEYQGIKMKKK